MTDSILLTIKRMLGYDVEYNPENPFDLQIIIHINANLAILTQVGVGPTAGFKITGDSETWSDFLVGTYDEYNELVKEFVYLKTKLVFDPPSSAAAIETFKEVAKQDLWRIREKAEGVFAND